MADVKQSTAYTRVFCMGTTSLTVSVSVSKAGASFAAANGAVSEIENGWYKIVLTTADTNTLGDLAYHCTASGADAVDFCDQVWAETNLSAITAKTGNLPSSPAAVGSAMTLTADYDAAKSAAQPSDIPAANANADALLDRADAIETGWTLRKILRIIAAAIAGKLSGAATTTITIRSVTDAKARITATVDADGNRTSVTLDGA